MDTGLICIQDLTLDVPFGSIKIQNFFFLEFFSTFTHEQIHFSYKIIRNELFFFFFLFLSKRSTILHILAQTIAIEKKNYGLDRICLSHDSTKMNLQFSFSSTSRLFTSTKTEMLFVASYFHLFFFNRRTKIKRG